MNEVLLKEDFIQYLLSTYSMDKKELYRLLDDLLNAYSESVDSYIQNRHLELQKNGIKNAEIFEMIQEEITLRRFPGPKLTVRQIRRVIYG